MRRPTMPEHHHHALPWARLVGVVVGVVLGCRQAPQPTDHTGDTGAAGAPASAAGEQASPGAAERRAACEFQTGAKAADTLDPGAPLGARIPIDHFVVVMQENRSFDHYFQKLPAYGQPQVDVAPPSYRNLDPSGEGELVAPFLLRDPCVVDVPHTWGAVHHQLAAGRMDGFLSAANPGGRRALGFYDASTLGYYYALATTFALGDHYFAAVPGPTYPNRMFFLSATSFGHTRNVAPPPRAEERTLFHQLEAAGLSWAVYADDPTFEEKVYPRLRAERGAHFRSLAAYTEDAAQGRLPFFSWVESTYGGPTGSDEHAPANVQLGQAFVAGVVAKLMASPAWPRSALFLLYDEHGGFFDHVEPPRACPPDDFAPEGAGVRGGEAFDHLGVRVPFVVVSPFARAHHVSHRSYSHTSVLRLVQARADLPAMTRRDANDEPPFDLFDFARPPFLKPPALPAPVIDPEQRARCALVAKAKKGR